MLTSALRHDDGRPRRRGCKLLDGGLNERTTWDPSYPLPNKRTIHVEFTYDRGMPPGETSCLARPVGCQPRCGSRSRCRRPQGRRHRRPNRRRPNRRRQLRARAGRDSATRRAASGSRCPPGSRGLRRARSCAPRCRVRVRVKVRANPNPGPNSNLGTRPQPRSPSAASPPPPG